MNFFEHLFGFSPDGGNGSLEIAVLLSSFIVFAGMLARKLIHRRHAARN